MSFSRRIELVSGIVTGLLWLAYWVALDLRVDGLALEGFLAALILFGITGLLVAVGAYAHAVRGKTWGRLMLTVGCAFLILGFLVSAFGGTGIYGGLVLFTTFAPSVTGIITVLASRSADSDAV